MAEIAVRTTCPYCGVGCGVIAARSSDGAISVSGDPEHPANFGRLCSKGAALAETISHAGRLAYPEIRGTKAGWDEALDSIASSFASCIAQHGPDSVALYVSGQLLTEDYYVANKLMKGFIGTANIDTNSRLCMASSVAGHKRAFGSDTVPGTYEDLEQADLVVLVGSNLAWCHPVLFQRLAAAREKRGTKVVVIDPRRSATCELADMHLPLKPGTDVALFNGLFVSLVGGNAKDETFVRDHTNGFKDAFATASAMPISAISRTTGLSQRQLYEFYDLFRRTERVVTIYSQGVNQSTAGTDKVNAIINCHLLTGRIGKPGMGPFSVTGQPNAMGGRETGGLANMLAAHMDLDNQDHRGIVQRFWQSPTIASKPGLKAVDMFRAVAEGRVKAIWIMATNPVDSMPEADLVRDALALCPFVVVSDMTRYTDTAAMAHVLLPSAAWGEKDGTVTNSERRISRQRAFWAAPDEARADWWQLAQVASRMGFTEQFAWTHQSEVFSEYAALTALENYGRRDLDIGACAKLTLGEYNSLEPFQWPRPAGELPRETRFFADGNFFTSDRRARLLPTPCRAPATACDEQRPFVLNTGRIRDQWHTMTRTARSARLMAQAAEPFAEINPLDARDLGIGSADLVRIASGHGYVVVRALLTDRQPCGGIFMPMHWTDQFASRARVDALIGSNTDPVSGQPELKHTPVSVSRFEAKVHGFVVSVERPALQGMSYWATAPAKSGWRTEFANVDALDDWQALLGRAVPRANAPDVDVLSYHDRASGQHRFAVVEGSRLVGAMFCGSAPVTAARDYLCGLIGSEFEPAARFRLLSGRAPGDQPDAGPTVCACFEVGRNQIAAALRGGSRSVAEVGEATRAGTNCGSCRAEIGRMIHADSVAKAI